MRRFANGLKGVVGAVLVLLGLAWQSPGSWADVVILRTGDKVVGLVKDLPTEPDKVLLVTASGEVVIPRKQILERTRESISTGYRRIAEVQMEHGQWDRALATLEKAAAERPVDPDVARLLQAVREKMVQEGLSKIEAQQSLNRQSLNEAEDAIASKDFEKAQRLLDSVEVTSPTTELRARWTKDTVALDVAWGLDREDKLDYAGAIRHFKNALEHDPQNETATDHLLNLWADDPAHREDVLKGYQRKLKADPNDILAARKLADLYVASGDLQQALPYLNQVVQSGKFPGMGYSERLANTYATLATQAAQKKDLDKAISLYSDFLRLNPDGDPRPLYYYQFLQKYDQVKPGDFAAYADLAEFLKSKGLDTEARHEIQSILSQDPKNAKALQLLNDYAQADLQQVRQDFQQGQFGMAMAGATRITQTYPTLPDVVAQASDIYTRAEIELKRTERERRNQARELVTLGDQYYQQAYFNANQLQSTERARNIRIINYREEAIKFAQRGIDAYQQALRIDPTLGTVAGGDIQSKINDLQQLYASLTQPPLPIPRITGQYGTSRF